MKSIIALAPIAALAAGLFMSHEADAGSSCDSGFIDVGGSFLAECSGGSANGIVRSGNASAQLAFVECELGFGSQLDAAGFDDDGDLINPRCTCRDLIAGDGNDDRTAPGECAPVNPGEVYTEFFFALFD